jgi:hypothetical protein
MDFQQTNILSMTGNSDFATTADLTGYVDLTTSQTITSGIKTFNTLPQSAVAPTTGNQFVNKTYVDGAFCTLGTAQTITGAKVINANLRLNNTRQLIFGTTTGAVLNFTGANMYYDNQAGGGHYFFISGSPNLYIDTTGLNIESGKRIWFNGGRCSITDNGTQLVYDVPTNNVHSFRTNNTQRMTISADADGTLLTFPAGTIMREYTSFNWFLYQLPAGHTLKYQVGGVDIMEVSNAGALIYESLSMRNGKRLVWDEGFTNLAHIRKDTTTSTFDYEVATGYSHKFMVNSVAQLLLNTSGATFTNPIFMKAGQAIYPDDTFLGGAITSGGSGGIRFDADTGGDFRFINDSTLALTIAGTNITIPSNQTLQFGVNDSNISYQAGTTSMRFKVPAGSFSHKWFNGTTEAMNLAYTTSSALNLTTNNSAIVIGSTNFVSVRQNTTLLCMLYNVPTSYTHYFTINSVMRAEILSAGFRVVGGYYCRTGSAGAFGTNVFNTYWTGAVLQCWIDGTNVGNFTISDYRVKENITKARPVLDRLCKVEMIEYEMKDVGIFKKHGTHHGFIAHQVKDLFPELDNIVSGEKDAVNEAGEIQPQTICAEFGNLYLSAIQELNAKIEAQQAQIDGLLVAMAKLVSQQIV